MSINVDEKGQEWVEIQVEICERCQKKCLLYVLSQGQNIIESYASNYADGHVETRLYLKNKQCPYALEHLMKSQ